MRLTGALVMILAVLAGVWPAAGAGLPGRAGQQESQFPSAAMAPYLGATVRALEVRGASEQDQGTLLQLLPLKTGDALEREAVKACVQALYDSGRFATIEVEVEAMGDHEVRLTFVTSPTYFVGDVSADGTPSRPTVNQVVNVAKFQLGEAFRQEKLDRALTNIRQLMEENGYYHSSVRAEQNKHDDTQQIELVFHVTPGVEARIGQVTVTGAPGYSQGQIQDIAHMHPGDPVTSDRVTSALDRIRKKYVKQSRLVAQVSVAERTYHPERNQVDYVFRIEPGPTVEIKVQGFKIKQSVLKQIVPVYEESAYDEDLLNEGRRNLLNYMQTRGYFEATVGILEQSDAAKNEQRAIYVVSSGARHKLAKVEIAGNNYFPTDQLLPRMQVQAAGRLLSHGRYSQGLLNDDIRGLETLYRSNGFAQVKITSDVEDNFNGQENVLALKLNVNEGPQTLVGALHIVGGDPVSTQHLPPLNTSEGQPYSESNVAEDREIILNYYFNRGFPDATFEAASKPATGEANRMDVTYTIQEGRPIFVDRVLVSGLNHTKPFIVQRELDVKPDTPLSQQDMLDTQRKLYDLGIFSQVDTAIQNPEGKEPRKNVLVNVQEAKRYTFNYGLGFEFQTGQPTVGTNQAQGETGVSPRVSFDVTRLNFRGRDHTVTFKSHVSRLQQRALVSYDAPRWFNSPNLRLSFTAFYDNTLDVTTFTSERLEGSLQAEQTISRASTMVYRFTYRRVRASNIEVSENLIPLLSQPVRVGMPGFSYIRDKRDNPLETTKGNYTTLDAGVASGYFGSQSDFSRWLVQNSTYQAFGKNRPQGRKFVLARSTRIGLETPFASTVIVSPGQAAPAGTDLIPLPERFLSGGGNSHRGFGLNQAGPRDPTTGFPLGGSALFINNLELRLPPVTLPYFDDNISFAVFHDMGNVFTSTNDMFHSLLHWKQRSPELCLQDSTALQCNYNYVSHAIGMGIRYKTPIGPVRFDFGYNLNPPAFPSCQATASVANQAASAFCPADAPYFKGQHATHFNVYFSIGQTF